MLRSSCSRRRALLLFSLAQASLPRWRAACLRRWSSPRKTPILRLQLRKPFTAKASESIPARMSSARSEEHTSELQSRGHLVCRLLLEKKKKWTHIQREERDG